MTTSFVEENQGAEDDLPSSAGLSGFNLLDERRLFAAQWFRPGMHVLDLGCGSAPAELAAVLAPFVPDN